MLSDIAEVVELIGSSEKSWADAAQIAVNEAIKIIRGVRGIDVKDLTAKVESDTGKCMFAPCLPKCQVISNWTLNKNISD